MLFHFALSQGPRVLVISIAVNIKFLLIIFKEGAGNVFLWLQMHITSNKHFIHCTSEFNN